MVRRKIQEKGRLPLGFIAVLALVISLNSCVPLAIVGGAIIVGAVADEGLKYEPSPAGGTTPRNQENTHTPPADDGGAGAYDLPVY